MPKQRHPRDLLRETLARNARELKDLPDWIKRAFALEPGLVLRPVRACTPLAPVVTSANGNQ